MSRLMCWLWYRGHDWSPMVLRTEDWVAFDDVGRMGYALGKSADPDDTNFTKTFRERHCCRCPATESIEVYS